MATATRSIFPTTAHTLCDRGVVRCGAVSCSVRCQIVLHNFTEQAAFNVVVRVQALSLFTVPSTRHDVQPRACAIHDALIVPLFAAIYRLTLHIMLYKGYIETRPASARL